MADGSNQDPKFNKALLRSCEACRIAKAKCIPNPNPAVSECQRCLKYNKTCIYAEARPRPKRGKQTHTRVAEVEKKLDSIYALLQAGRHPDGASKTDGSSTDQTITAGSSPFSWEKPAQPTILSPPESCRAHVHRRPDVIDKGLLSTQEANELLQIYRIASGDFPFIYLDPAATLESLRWDKPFLTLSILVMASPRARSLQVLLEKELRELLAQKVIVEGELSLDLLQGLLVYLAWYHFNFRPCRQQIYQLTQLAGSMVIDLELQKPPREKTGFILHTVRACMACKKDTAAPMSSITEAKRTFVGTYYLTSALSLMLRKPNGLAWSRYVNQCCEDLAEEAEAPMDPYLIHYVRLQRIAEEVGEMFGYGDPGAETNFGPERIQLSVRAFMANLQDIRKEFQPEVLSMPSIMAPYYTMGSFIHEIMIHIDVSKLSPSSSPSPSNLNKWHTSTIRTDLLLGCIESIKACLDWYAGISAADFERFTVIDLSRLSYSLLLLGRLTLSGGPGFNVDIVEQTANVVAYFDVFNGIFEQLVALQGGEPRRSIYWHFQRIFTQSRSWFSAKIAECRNGGGGGGAEAGAADGGLLGAPGGRNVHVLSPMSLIDPGEEMNFCMRAKEQAAEAEQVQQSAAMQAMLDPAQDGIWEEMMAVWPMSMEGSVLF